ncbi:membrane-bound inhibitor of C-type lysozyme [Aminobacter aminovorans]|jgi:membrane-bound inhibitor of C-type lysozyme|uniref:Membrane-bound lysozyme inhibitor of C-type lysozyme n=1 Tax=Aminobacter aminovorans TaxID=83263 RepID=A0A380WR22_AMIAI|nr:MliC family protein [Aminobacter aminovorans]TCS30534.1 membrane-bound inhibitor of C-type lysozyme [Aminobacter aminovorans]SUU91383.1 Membrane-bound lysozyme inhibitor of C-type lysozyme precursor [Aminobacter aminovorans]
MRLSLTAIILAAATRAAMASTVTLELPGDAKVEHNAVDYKCGDQTVKAEYVNAGDNSLVVLTLGDQTVVAVTVLSASGARYAGQQFIWWTKGDNADLYDLTKGEDAPATLSCEAVK